MAPLRRGFIFFAILLLGAITVAAPSESLQALPYYTRFARIIITFGTHQQIKLRSKSYRRVAHVYTPCSWCYS
jgi:hypothetical protein